MRSGSSPREGLPWDCAGRSTRSSPFTKDGDVVVVVVDADADAPAAARDATVADAPRRAKLADDLVAPDGAFAGAARLGEEEDNDDGGG